MVYLNSWNSICIIKCHHQSTKIADIILSAPVVARWEPLSDKGVISSKSGSGWSSDVLRVLYVISCTCSECIVRVHVRANTIFSVCIYQPGRWFWLMKASSLSAVSGMGIPAFWGQEIRLFKGHAL